MMNTQEQTVEPRRRMDRKPIRDISLNLTSMLDVCFMLLIFFILTASFTVGEGILPANMPFDGPAETQDLPTPPVVVAIRSSGGSDVQIWLDGVQKPMTGFREMHIKLKQMNGTVYSDETPLEIRPDPQVPWQHVVNAFNQAVRAQYKVVRLSKPS